LAFNPVFETKFVTYRGNYGAGSADARGRYLSFHKKNPECPLKNGAFSSVNWQEVPFSLTFPGNRRTILPAGAGIRRGDHEEEDSD
jgi:hypothetical protein